MKSQRLPDLIDASVLASTDGLAREFARRDPFRHVVIEGFFDAGYAERLLATFPAFERGNARNEAGELGGKSTVENLRALGPAYAALDDLARSPDFLALIGRITGIPDLLYDPYYFGGGTHENRAGQDLDAHVDFNRHPVENWHRRLNLIVYLNPEWHDGWGGSLELHSDPRSPHDRVKRVTPLFNRAVLFETTEWSWHGFQRIVPPPDRPDLTRRSVALYFYTRERPVEELADPHSTIYVDAPIPDPIRAGHTLTEHDMQELRTLLARRDQHNQRLYGDITRLSKELRQARDVLYSGPFGRLRYFAGKLRARLRQRAS